MNTAWYLLDKRVSNKNKDKKIQIISDIGRKFTNMNLRLGLSYKQDSFLVYWCVNLFFLS